MGSYVPFHLQVEYVPSSFCIKLYRRLPPIDDAKISSTKFVGKTCFAIAYLLMRLPMHANVLALCYKNIFNTEYLHHFWYDFSKIFPTIFPGNIFPIKLSVVLYCPIELVAISENHLCFLYPNIVLYQPLVRRIQFRNSKRLRVRHALRPVYCHLANCFKVRQFHC